MLFSARCYRPAVLAGASAFAALCFVPQPALAAPAGVFQTVKAPPSLAVEVRRRHRGYRHRRGRSPAKDGAEETQVRKLQPQGGRSDVSTAPPAAGSEAAPRESREPLPLPAFPTAPPETTSDPEIQKPPQPPALPDATAAVAPKIAAPEVKVPTPSAQPPSLAVSTPEAPSKPAEVFGPPPPPIVWTQAEIEAARRECDWRLPALGVVYERLDPLREGACGTPAPIRLKGLEEQIGPAVTFAPAPTITCKLGEALRRWFAEVVQPKAKEHLNATVVRVGAMSGYDCRSRNGGFSKRISQHAYANALDIGTFVTARGEKIVLEDHWDAGDERAAFLRAIHAGACRIFGTTLGPEANEAHSNHLHLDMTERRTPLCDFTGAEARAREAQRKAAALAAKQATTPVPVSGELSPKETPVVYGPPLPPVPVSGKAPPSEKPVTVAPAPASIPASPPAVREAAAPKAVAQNSVEKRRARKAVETRRRKPIRRRARLPFGIRF
ncbi:extensin family protein [Rhodomicrobium vannielii ATCC 17100]|uniref:extensin family protein n=1 Tax=Rhodomicrobium vannielii TaxID=1069 RepID=UPI00191A61D6|nr:extensin family protein [Rhodomicrobium vannielii]MBJ7534114.1 extensin family protein [Rhodomicrobium vannielii ATCC 17100]